MYDLQLITSPGEGLCELERGRELPPCSFPSSSILSAGIHCRVNTHTVKDRGVSDLKGDLPAGGGRNVRGVQRPKY